MTTVTTHSSTLTLGSTFQIEESIDDGEHAEAPERPRDRAMSLHERSLLAHDLHALSNTMETIRDEEEEIAVGTCIDNAKSAADSEAAGDRRASMTGVPVSATSFVARTQPTTICEAAAAAESDAAAAAPAVADATAAASIVSHAENDRGSISCEMLTRVPVLSTGGGGAGEGTVGDEKNQSAIDGEAAGTVTTHSTMVSLGGATLQIEESPTDEEHAEAPERPRDRAMSLHERSLLAHDLHAALSNTMETIRDEEEEVAVGTSFEPKSAAEAESVSADRRASMTGVPISATTFVAPAQPTIFESESAAAPAADSTAAPAADAAAPSEAVAHAEHGITSNSSQGPNGAASDTVAQSIDITVTPSADTVTSSSSEVTTAAPMAPGSMFQMDVVETHEEEHAEGPERPRDRAMSLHERSLLAHDQHAALSSTMETIRDEEEEVPVGKSFGEPAAADDSYVGSTDRRASLTGVPVSATTFVAPAQPTIFEAAESAPAAAEAAAAAPPAAQEQPAAAAAAAAAAAEPAPEPSPYLKKLLDAQEQTRQLMELLGESSQVLGTLPSSQQQQQQQRSDDSSAAAAAAELAAAAAAATAEISSDVTVTSQSSSSMSSSSSAAVAPATDAAPAAAAAAEAPPPSPAIQISARPIEITIDGGAPVASPTAAAAADATAAAAAATAADAAKATQNASICSALTDIAANMVLTSQQESSTAAAFSSSSFTSSSSSSSAMASTTTIDAAGAAPAASAAAAPPTPTTTTTASADVVFAAAAAAPPTAAAAAPVQPAITTPAAVEVPVEIVRRLDDAAAWHSAASRVDADADAARAVPIAVVPAASGPPPLAREAPEAPSAPPPLARDQPHHDFSRSVAVERRVLSPDSAAHAADAAAAAAQQQQAAAAAAVDAPLVQQQQPEAEAAAAAAAEASEPVAAALPQQYLQQQQAPAADSASSQTTAHAPQSPESTFQITPSEQEDVGAQPPTQPRDRAMSIHEKSLLAYDSSGFQPGLEPLAEAPADAAVEVHVATAIDADARRASLAAAGGGCDDDGAAASSSSAFQAPSTSCLFTVEEGGSGAAAAAPVDETPSTAPATTASPSEQSPTTTIASSTGGEAAVIDVTAAAPPPAAPAAASGGIKWADEQPLSSTPESSSAPAPAPVTVVQLQQQPEAVPAAAPATQDQPLQPAAVAAATEPTPPTPKTPSSVVNWISEPAPAGAPSSEITEPQTPKSPSSTGGVSPLISDPAAPTPQNTVESAPPVTPKSPLAGGIAWSSDPVPTGAAPVETAAPTCETAPSSAPAAAPPIVQSNNGSEPVPATPKSPSAGVTWSSEPAPTGAAAAPVETLSPAAGVAVVSEPTSGAPSKDSATPQTPKTPAEGVSWMPEPAPAAALKPNGVEPPATPKSPSGINWISEPAPPAPAAAAATPPQTPKTPSGVAWITEPAPPAAAVIDITAPPGAGGAPAAAPPLSPGIKWASDTTRTGGNVAEAGGAPASPAPAVESAFLVDAPWSGSGGNAAAAAASAPDADGVAWITEPPVTTTPGSPKEASGRPPLTRSESTRSDREASSATDVTVRAATPQRKTLAPSMSVEEVDAGAGVTQEAPGTKVRKLSWADQREQKEGTTEDSFSAAIDDYEKKLNETTAQTRELVDLLCQTGSALTENSVKMSDVFSDAVQASVRSMLDQERRDQKAAALSPIAENGYESIPRDAPPHLLAGALPPNVESVIVSCPELTFVTGSLVLESANILVTDEEAGLFLFTLDSKVVRHVTNPSWKRPASPVLFKDRLKSYLLVLMDCKDEEGQWARHIVKLTENLDYIEKIECPVWIKEKSIVSDRLAVNRYENIYYCANGELFSGLYELAPTGRWTELLYRQSESFIDMLVFAIIGPIQQILIVEGRRDHVLLCSVRESQCVEARRMAICERPGALARDECGRLFVMNRAQAAVQIVDTRVWAAARNMALVDKFVPHFSAAFGMLVIPQKRAVKVHKYAFEWDD